MRNCIRWQKNLEKKLLYDKFQVFIFCFKEPTDTVLFIKDFSKSYASFINRYDNPFDIQLFNQDDPKKVRYYTSDLDYTNEGKDIDLMTNWMIVNDNGIVFSGTNVKENINFRLLILIHTNSQWLSYKWKNVYLS